ncbi:oxidoreductase [Pseudonocardia sp. CA-107938]|uniref:oxidoreductase n=1 Tax=Pseudonocardia sp. CA-107938 TaxID=3240021 RepID=UPI003D91874E
MDRFPLAGHTVGRVGYGAMQLPGPGVFGPPRDRAEALAVLRRVVELGIDHIDTSQYYGPDVANELIRDALHPYPADLAIVSKVGARRDDTGAWLPWDDPADLRQGIEDNLACLRVEQLAAVNLRLLDEKEPPGQRFDDQLGAMVEARDAGLIAGIGLSNITVEHLRRARQQTEIACVQNPYNLLDRSSDPVLAECTAAGIAFVPFFPLGSGFNPQNPVLNNDTVRAAAERLGIGAAQVVLAWTLTVAPNVLLIPGTSSVAHLEENTAVRDVELPADVVAELNALA